MPNEINIRLMDFLPRYYHDSRIVWDIQDANEAEINVVRSRIYDMLDQFYVSTATWGLSVWEDQFGLPDASDRSDEERREMILAKMRGAGTTTKEMIENVAISFSGGEVEVDEYPRENRFDIRFVGVLGIPPNMDGLAEVIEEIKPAHLAYNFVYTFTWWDTLRSFTWDEASENTWDEIRYYDNV